MTEAEMASVLAYRAERTPELARRHIEPAIKNALACDRVQDAHSHAVKLWRAAQDAATAANQIDEADFATWMADNHEGRMLEWADAGLKWWDDAGFAGGLMQVGLMTLANDRPCLPVTDEEEARGELAKLGWVLDFAEDAEAGIWLVRVPVAVWEELSEEGIVERETEAVKAVIETY